MSICMCYHDEENFLHERGVCYGTKEKEPCSCGGNPVKCDFYEEVREKYIHQTRADRIRAMTNDELAKLLWDVWRHKGPFYKECVDGWACPFYHWLKQEVNDDLLS